MDGDGIIDFELRRGFTYGQGQPPDPNACLRPFGVQGHGLHALQDNHVLLSTQFDCFGPLESIAPGTQIGPNPLPHQSWGRNGDTFNILLSPIGLHETNGPLATATSAIVGVQFTSARGRHFGWVEVSSPAPGDPPRIVRFAAEGAPSTPIVAGGPPVTPFPKPLTPLLVPPSNFLIGGVLIESSTNASTGQIVRHVEISTLPEIECLIAPKQPSWPDGAYPAALVERTFLPNPLPSGWAWRKPGENLRLYSRIEETDGTFVEHFGPLAESKFVLIGLRKPQGETWWIEFERSGDIRFLSYSPANSGLLLVGNPSSPLPSINTSYFDIDRDGLIDFVESSTSPIINEIQRTLYPTRGQKILIPSNVNRFGALIATEPPPSSTWSTNSLTLMQSGFGEGVFGIPYYFYRSVEIPAGTNGYIAVQFMSGTNTHVGWIQFNRFEVFRGVHGMSIVGSPILNFFDHGYARAPGTPSIIGADSSLSLALQIQEAGKDLHLRWDPLRRDSSRLEVSTSISSSTWNPVFPPGINELLYPKPTTPGPLFFRLHPVEANPPLLPQ